MFNNVLVEAGGDLASIKNKKEVNAILHDTLLNFPVTFDPENNYVVRKYTSHVYLIAFHPNDNPSI